MFPCSFCELVFNSIDNVVGHIRLFHPVNFGSGYVCKFSDCDRSYDSLATFTEHLKRNHVLGGPFLNNVPIVQNNAAATVLAGDPELNDFDLPAGDLPDVNIEVDPISEETLCKTFSNAALVFMSKLYSVNTMNRSDTDLIISYSNQLLLSIVLNLKRKVREQYGHDLDRVFDIAENVFQGLETESQRFSALQSSEVFVKPDPFTFDYVGEYHGNYDPVLRQVPLVGQHVKMLNVLKVFFELPGVFDTVLNNYDSLVNSESPVCNLVQGKLWKDNIWPNFAGKTVLPLAGYFDDTEPDNCQGSHATDHKLGCMYYSCPVIPQKFLAALKNIFVSTVVLCNDRNVLNGNEKVFRVTIEELYLGEMIGDLVPEDDPVCELYILLREIIDILFAPEYSAGTERFLHVLIVEHHSLYMELFLCNLKPKYHFMLHYSTLMLMLGPLVHLSSIRCEAKHRELKQVARATNSRINLPYTVVLKHQLRQCYRFMSGDGLKVEFAVGLTQLVHREIIDPQGLLRDFIPPNGFVNVAKWVSVCGVYFKCGMLLHVAYYDNLPCFTKITEIVYDGIDFCGQPKIYFVCKAYKTNSFSRHYHSYRVSEGCDITIVPYGNTLSVYPLLIRGGDFVTTRC
ncbi:hypothetical protein ONE63_003471 [Megalurothrips usitatus]|uniref:C2H2-type domain-containing protein n=1 Tax=Megalurothrips usitatus TaxID=439358 RepID=A0AAV7XB33_9NEOP|nr:hypothetical protein ONE63_003471 [Megalurothrips usitatus]